MCRASCVSKPFEIDELLAEIERVLRTIDKEKQVRLIFFGCQMYNKLKTFKKAFIYTFQVLLQTD